MKRILAVILLSGIVTITEVLIIKNKQPEVKQIPETVSKSTEIKTTATETTESVKKTAKIETLSETIIKDTTATESTKSGEFSQITESVSITPEQFRKMGVVYADGFKWTWYSERVLPGQGLNIPGRYSDGNYVRDGDGNIVLASCDYLKGTVLNTPFGRGKVYDYCPTSGVIDVYVSW